MLRVTRATLRWPLLLSALVGPAAPAMASEPTPMFWLVVRENPFALDSESFAVDGRGRIAYVFGGDGYPHSPQEKGYSPAVYRLALDGPGLDWQLASSGGGPSGRTGAHMHFDRARQRLLVTGGLSAPEVVERDLWSWDPIGDDWSAMDTAHLGPDSLWSLQPMVHDTRRDRLLFLGSGFETPLRTWALELAGAEPDWSEVVTTNAPPATFFAAAVYDSIGDRVFLFGGGTIPGGANSDLWQLDLGTGAWSKILSDSPFLETLNARLFWEAGSNRLVAHSPAQDASRTAVAVLPLDAPPAWQPLNVPGGPSNPISARPWAYDAVAGELLVEVANQPTPVLYVLRGDPVPAWTERYPAGRCLFADGVAHVADVAGRGWYLHRGTTLWRIDLDDPAEYEEVVATGTGPASRTGHSAAWDSLGNRIVFYGGADAADAPFVDTWALELGPTPHWSEIVTTGPGPVHVREPATFDIARRALYVKSGSWLWRLDLTVAPAAWEQVFVGPLPDFAAMALDRVTNRLLAVSPTSGFAIDLDPPVEVSPTVPQAVPYAGGAAYAYDSRRRQLIIHDGVSFVSNTTRFYREHTDAFRASTEPLFVDLRVLNASATAREGSIAVHDPGRDRVLLLNGFRELGLWTLQFDGTTPARMDLVAAAAEDGGIRVRFAGAGFSGDLVVERTEAAIDAWSRVGSAAEITPGTYEFVDGAAAPGVAYRYRGRFFDEAGERVTAPSAEVRLGGGSGATAFALTVQGGTIVRGTALEFDIAFVAGGPATLDVIDVRGRRVGGIAFEGIAGETRRVSIALRGGLAAGLYFARLRQGVDERRARFIRL